MESDAALLDQSSIKQYYVPVYRKAVSNWAARKAADGCGESHSTAIKPLVNGSGSLSEKEARFLRGFEKIAGLDLTVMIKDLRFSLRVFYHHCEVQTNDLLEASEETGFLLREGTQPTNQWFDCGAMRLPTAVRRLPGCPIRYSLPIKRNVISLNCRPVKQCPILIVDRWMPPASANITLI